MDAVETTGLQRLLQRPSTTGRRNDLSRVPAGRRFLWDVLGATGVGRLSAICRNVGCPNDRPTPKLHSVTPYSVCSHTPRRLNVDLALLAFTVRRSRLPSPCTDLASFLIVKLLHSARSVAPPAL